MRPKFENLKDYLYWRLDRRVELIKQRAEKVKRRYLDPRTDDAFINSEYDRIWLDGLAKGTGFEICCGDFLIGDDQQAIGIDGHAKMVGTDWFSEGDELQFQEPGKLDYIVTNYLEGLPNPLKALNEWYRCLRLGGTLAIVCRNADRYINHCGPLSNGSRQTIYNKNILKFYMERAGFEIIGEVIETEYNSLRAVGIKK